MQYYRITAELQSPLIIQQNRQSNSSENLPFLPGSSLRGALAAQFLRNGGNSGQEEFRQLFIEDPLYFPNLLPAGRNKTIPKILPLTSVSCKREAGFLAQNKHGVVDLLASNLKERMFEQTTDDKICEKCRQDMKSIGGFWNGDTTSPEHFRPSMLYQRHTGIDRVTGTVAESVFFIRQSLADYFRDSETGQYKRQWLSGGIYLNNLQRSLLEPLLETPVFAGADRTSGMGELQLSVDEASELAPTFDIGKWDSHFKKKLADLGVGDLPQGKYFSINLESDAILVDQFLRPAPQLELDLEGVQLVAQFTKAKTIRGWQSSWGLPKHDDIGFTMGTVFLFRYSGSSQQSLNQYLGAKLISGIGLRREEGFGKISICNPVHTIKEVI